MREKTGLLRPRSGDEAACCLKDCSQCYGVLSPSPIRHLAHLKSRGDKANVHQSRARDDTDSK